MYNLLRLLLDSEYCNANLQSRASCPTRHSLVEGKKYPLHLKNERRKSVLAQVLYVAFSFLISNSEPSQSPELQTFLFSEIIKTSLNYHLMVILPATCRLQNPATALMKGISAGPRPLYTWTVAFRDDYMFAAKRSPCKAKVTVQAPELLPSNFLAHHTM